MIRVFRPEDAVGVQALGSNSTGAGQWSAASYERIPEMGQQGWVVENDGMLTGFLVVRIISPEMEILNLAVAAESRRNGLAARLLAAAEKKAREENVSRVFLEVRESNSTAISFYGRIGFRKMGLRKDYYRDPLEDAILMEKGITPDKSP